jgi:hypothetical protein
MVIVGQRLARLLKEAGIGEEITVILLREDGETVSDLPGAIADVPGPQASRYIDVRLRLERETERVTP